MATDYTKDMARYIKDVARQLEKMVAEQNETNKWLKKIKESVELKSFDELVPPPRGTVIQNMLGTTFMNTIDFEEMQDGQSEED